MTVLLDGKTIRSREEFHTAVKTALCFPAYYGNNLDALMDCLTDIEAPTTLHIVNFSDMEANLGSYAAGIRRVLTQAAQTTPALTVQINQDMETGSSSYSDPFHK